jgi:hypothetical protein
MILGVVKLLGKCLTCHALCSKDPASRAGLIASPSSLLAQYRSLLQGSTHGEQAADPIVTLTEDQIQFLRQGEEDAFRRFGPPGWNFPRNL